jgi:NodT family efflux transporter outer membrane factor (OMF) lipoprotein
MNQFTLTGRTRLFLGSLLITVLLTAGCVRSTGIDHQGATLAMPATGTDPDFSAWPSDRWWETYDSPALSRLIEHGLADSPGLQTAQARLMAARAGTEFANARQMPQLGLGMESTFQRYSEKGLIPPSTGGEHRTDNRFALDFNYELDLFGKNAAILKSAEAQTRAMEIETYTARMGIATAIAKSWFLLAEAVAERAVIIDTLHQRQKVLELVLARVAQGLDSKVEQRQAEGAIPQIEGELAAVDERIGLIRAALARLAVVPLAETAALAPVASKLHPPTLPATVPSSLVARRPEIVAAGQRVASLLKGIEAVKAEFYPSVNLAAFAGFSALGLGALLEEGAQVYGLTPAIRLPIFDAGRLRAKLKFLNAQLDMAIADYNEAVLSSMQDVIHSMISIRALAERNKAQHEAQLAAESAYDIAVQRFRAGLTGYLTVLATETEVLQERRAGVLLAARAYQLDVDLKRALGGGFDGTAFPAPSP